MGENQKLVLIVDDEPDFREIIATKLQMAGYRIEVAINGEEGIKKAAELKPDLVLMDVKMPGMSGADALVKLRDDPATKDLKVVFLTSLGDPREEIQEMNNRFSKELGAQGYLKKTDDLDDLLGRVQAFLG